ncbi:hypothetical protein GGF46_002203 [Coemansia sp. RSA 552]|nr:hypothetical protein GGF46_002203 [Coemansia sp. RSA 552]
MYSPVSGLAATGGGGGGMMADATPASKPSPPAGYSGHGPHTDDSTPAPSGMVESPTSVGAGVAGMRIHHHPATPGPGGRSHSTGTAAAAAAGSSTLQKVEKNRFQASIRAFVDQHFMAADNMRWDYQQSFKAPRNAEATHQMAESFRNSNGGSYERVEHGLGVYFSSLKAKHRTTEDKAMLKQQRDRRRARRIKKAAGRRKVFDRANFPFLADDFDAQRCFVPLAMSPEHTDDDGEVKVGVLPWRLTPYSDLFHHLDSLRPKRTPRPNNPLLSGGEMPPPGIPDFMISPAYISMDRTRMGHEHDHDPEDIATNPDPEDIEMESSSDGGGRERSASGMYM